MLFKKLTIIFSGCLLGLSSISMVHADHVVVQAALAAPSAAETAYQKQMLALSEAIAAKISQIQTLQQQIDAEIYLAAKPPLVAQQAQLQEELANLQMRQQQLQAQKTAADLSTSLKQGKS